MCFRKIFVIILMPILFLYLGLTKNVFAAKISNCTNCNEIHRVSKNELCDAYKTLKKTLNLESTVADKQAMEAPRFLGKMTTNPCTK